MFKCLLISEIARLNCICVWGTFWHLRMVQADASVTREINLLVINSKRIDVVVK